MFNKLFFLIGMIFVGQISLCPDETCFFVISYGPPHHVRNRYRLEMQNCTKAEGIEVLRKYYENSYHNVEHPLNKAQSKAVQQKTEGRWGDFSLVEQRGSMPVNDDKWIKFSFLYGFDSEAQACAHGPGSQILVSEVFGN